MKLFDNDKKTQLQLQNRVLKRTFFVLLAIAVVLCVACVILVNTLGRTACQTVATAVTFALGCYLLVWQKQRQRNKKIIDICKKCDCQKGVQLQGVITKVEDYTTTLFGLKFYAMDIATENGAKTIFLYHTENAQSLLNKQVTAQVFSNVIFWLEVAQ